MGKTRLFVRVFVLVIPLLVIASLPRLANAGDSDAQDLKSVWERVHVTGSYDFSADVTQISTTQPAVIKVGPTTQKTRLHLEGRSDLAARSLDLTLWNGGGSVLLPESGVQIQIADGQARARRGDGTWEQIEDFSGSFAPDGDFLVMLSAADNIVQHAPEVRTTVLGEVAVTRYEYEVNGERYAQYMRDLMSRQMTARGELPQGMRLDLPDVYARMTGRGELLVGEDGLPISQVFELNFPEGNYGGKTGEAVVQAEVIFSNFGTFETGAAGSPIGRALNRLFSTETVLSTLVILIGLVLLGAAIHRSRSKPVYAAVVLTVSFSMVVSPLLNSSQVAAFGRRQAEKQAAQEARQDESDAANAWQEALGDPSFDPHAHPLELAEARRVALQATETSANSLAASGVISTTSDSSEYFDSSCETDPGGDNDGDSLTNLEECLIGTLPGAVDTDQDGVDDGLEVNGFVLNNNSSTTWYTNPLYPDSNRDGEGDGSEWNFDADADGLPDDTDKNGIPDLWDDDNDGDGVPDDLDLSPYSSTKNSNVFTGDDPFQLIVDDLGDGLITKVEFQLSPTNPEHLWYTNNVLDWADNDYQGQMQDADGLTFYDVDNTVDPWPNDLGDVRLVPMLEIEITGTPDNLPDAQTLDQFDITVHDTSADTKTAYVPVTLVTDTTGNKNVAFHGAMYYQADSSWGNAHSVRLVWMVQALVDVCDTYKNGICDTYSEYNNLQVIHSYDEEWYLTGMEISEERGTNIAAIYEDPGATSDAPLYIDTLSQMAYGLDRTFIAGADCDTLDQYNDCVSGNGELDLTVAGIYTRFNHTTNSGVSAEQRWGLSNVLSVQTNSYAAIELAMMDLIITQTVDILENAYTSHWTAASPITPTIMFAWEHNYRVVSLGNDHLIWSGNALTADIASSGIDPVQAEQENGMKWAPYAYNSTDGWFAADIYSYWDDLDYLLLDSFSGDEDIATDVTIAKFLYLGLYSGEANVVKFGDLIIPQDYQTADLPIQLEIASWTGSGIKKAVNLYVGDVSVIRDALKVVNSDAQASLSNLEKIALKIDRSIQQYVSILEESIGKVGIGLLLFTSFAALVVAGIYLYRKYIAHDNISTGWLIAGGVALGVLTFIVGVIKPVLSIIKTINGLVEVGGAATKAAAVRELLLGEGAPSIEYNVVGLVVSVAISFIFLMVLVFSGAVKPGSIAAQMLGAQTIASIIVALIVFILNLTPFTALLVGLVALIDLLLFALGLNFSITGWLTNLIAHSIYQFDLSVDMGVETGSVSTALANPEEGMVAGNQMIFTMPITTVITQSNKVEISEDEFRSNSLVYDLDSLDAYQSGLSTTHGDRADDWSVVQSSVLGYIGTVSDTVSYAATLSPGVNRSYIFYLDSAYDLLGISCWWWKADCKNKYVQGTNSSEIGSTFIFDVYPSTVEEFVDVTGWSNGNLRIADADGDGLLPLGAGGVDPDDSNWDTDGDQLSDSFELSMRALAVEDGGEALDVLLSDTDGDGIPDNEELWLATNPANADSDGDGLPDVDEAARADSDLLTLDGGWLFAYRDDAFTRVWSDPNNADYDGDGMTDLFELTQDTCPDCTPWADPNNPQLFSPYVYNENPVPIYLDDNTNDGFVTPGTSFVYSTTTENNLSEGIVLAGEVALALPDIFAGAPLTAEVALSSGYSETLASEISPGVSGSATGVLTSTMDLDAFEDVVWAWDPAETSSMLPIAGDIKQLDAASAPGFSDLYVFTALEIDSSGQQYITAYTAGNSGSPSDAAILFQSTATLGAPEVACNDAGNCLVVWSYTSSSGASEVLGLILNETLENHSGSLLFGVGHSSTLSSPVAASDGENFMAGWTESSASEAKTWAVGVNQDSSQILPQGPVWVGSHSSENSMGLVWTGSTYLAVWINGYDATMYRSEIDTSLNIGPVTTVPGDASIFANANGVDGSLTLSYDTLSNQALVVFRDLDEQLANSTYFMNGLRLTASGASAKIHLDTINTPSVFYADIAACADPQNGGWIVVWSKNNSPSDPNIHYQAIAPDGSLRGSEQSVSTSNENAAVALACRPPNPLLALEFEEDTSSASYVDSSQYGNDASCDLSSGACPLGGVEGRFGNGVLFDGINDELSASFTQPGNNFSVEFWLKTTCQDCDILNFLGGDVSIYLDAGRVCASVAGPQTTNTFCSSASYNVADGDWHHIFHTTPGTVQYLWLDGRYQTNFSLQPVVCTNNCDQFVLGTAGNNFFDGTLDEVRFHNRSFSTAEIQAAFDSAVTILDLDETAGSTTAYDSSDNGFNATCSGSSCPTFGVDGAANTAVEFDGTNDYLAIESQKRTLASFVYDFEGGDTGGWSDSTLSTATRNGESTSYLGNYGNENVDLSLSNLPTHDTVTIAFDLYVMGSWGGSRTDLGPDNWKWGYDSTRILETNFSNQPDTSPNYQAFPAWYNDPAATGITLYENSDLSGASETFYSDDSDLRDNTIGNDRASAFRPVIGTAAILYQDINYGGSSWIMDVRRNNNNVPTNDTVSSLRVFPAFHSPGYGSTGEALVASGFSETSVYHVEYTLYDHTASNLTLFFEGLASDSGSERWGLDNVVVDVQSDGGSVPLTNSSFTLSAWAKRASEGTSDYILGQGTGVDGEGLYFGYNAHSLACAIWGDEIGWSLVNDGDWHHVACTYDNTQNELVLYYDGAQVGTLTTGIDYSGFGETVVGNGLSGEYFDGTLDEIGIWPYTLTADQVLELFQKVKVEDQSVLHAVVPVQEDEYLYTVDLVLRETATGAGTEAQVVTRTIGIDADSPSATILAPTDNAYVSGLQALEISGSASDPTSYVTAVEVQVDGGSWAEATGTESWSYTIPAGTLGDGLHSASARATDVVNSVGSPDSVQFIVDDTAPNSTLTTLGTIRPFLDDQGRWLVPISGTAADPAAGSQAGSGLVSVEVLLQGGPNVVGNGWQTATLSANNWNLNYVLPQVGTQGVDVSDPTGLYTVTVRATDAVDNTAPEADYVTGQLNLEVDPPIPTLSTILPITETISTALTLSGVISDATYISSVEIGFTPGSNIDALSEAVMHLSFDENNALTHYFQDRSGSNNPAKCTSEICPLIGQPGQRDLALEFDGVDDYLYTSEIDLANQSFTVAAWAKRDVINQNHVIVSHGQTTTNHGFILLFLNGNHVSCTFWANSLVSTEAYPDTDWHHWACSYDVSTGLRTLYRDGVQIAQDNPGSNYLGSGDFLIGRRQDNIRYFDGSIDEVTVIDRALADYEVADLYNYGRTTWISATFDSSVLYPTWSYTLPEGVNGLEGIYQINVRATDIFSNVTQTDNQRMWRGEIDTRPPTLVFSATQVTVGSINYTEYICNAVDFNLDEDTSCQVVPPDTIPDFSTTAVSLTQYAEIDLWYAEVISDTSRLYRMYADELVTGNQSTAMSIEACDLYGRCTTASNSALNAAALGVSSSQSAGAPVSSNAVQLALELDAGVITPTNGTVLTATIPITAGGYALAAAGLQSLSVTANDVEVYSQSWPVSPTITNTLWSFAWTPPDQGIYHLEATAQDWSGTSTAGTLAPTVYVDTESPSVVISPVVITTTQQLGANVVRLTGAAFDSLQVQRVDVSVEGGPWQKAGLMADGSWSWPWLLAGQPDGSTFSVSARATDPAGRTALDTETVLVDLVPPERLNVTLTYQNGNGQVLPIAAGETLTDAVSLQADWTTSSDGSGIAGYYVGWSQNPAPVLAELTPYPDAGSHSQPVGEAETWYAHVQVVDGAGNTTAQTLGPVYVDGRLTPDVTTDLSYHGWANEICTIEGIDRRLAQTHPEIYGDWQQRFFVTWDVTALRLYWQGANWNHDGDLFIYLDTRPGGSDRLFNPYPGDAATTIYLPGNLPDPAGGTGARQLNAQAGLAPEAGLSATGADYMVWVESEEQAGLYRWDGFAWTLQQALDGDQFLFKPGTSSSDTDLRLPFADLGIADPAIAALGVLAVATEEEALQIWSTMPVRNPLNSGRVVNPLAGQINQHTFPLVRSYFWDSLGSGLCGNGRLSGDGRGPTGGPFADSDLQVTITADPVGTSYSFVNDEMSWLWALLFGFEAIPTVPSELFTHQDNEHPLLGPGQTLTYTINYANLGTETAAGMKVELDAWYSLQLDGDGTVELGDIPPGETGSVQITASINPTGLTLTEQEWAALDAFVYDDQYPENPTGGSWSAAPLEWLWSDHRVDVQPPSALTIDTPDFVIPAGLVTVRGQVVDESPVPQTTLEVLDENGDVETVNCYDDTPTDGRWACNWDAGNAGDGEIFQIRVQATDRFGQSSEWTPWHTLEVDATPPEISVNGSNLFFGPGIHHFGGGFFDERQVGSVHVCLENGRCIAHVVDPQPDVPPGALAQTGIWTTYLLPPGAGLVDGQTQTLTVYGKDAAGNRSPAVNVTYQMDFTPPVLSVDNVAAFVPAASSRLIASGTVSDGSHIDVNVLVDLPDGTRQRIKAAVNGEAWSFTHAWTETGGYSLWVQAVDAAGNATTMGPFTLLVGTGNQIFLPAFFQDVEILPPGRRR